MDADAWATTLVRHNGAPFVAGHPFGRMGQQAWRPYAGGKALHAYRTVLPSEMVADIGDHTPWPVSVRTTSTISRTLRRFGIPHLVALSGGDGLHIHVFGPGGGDDWRAGAMRVILDAADHAIGFIGACEVDGLLVAPRPDSRMIREFGYGKYPLSPYRKCVWFESGRGPFLPIPLDKDEAYAQAYARGWTYPSTLPVGEPERLDTRPMMAALGGVCPIRPDACLTGLPCDDCPGAR